MKLIRTYSPIELSDNQKEKLLLMASTLFPNRNWEIWNCDSSNWQVKEVIGHNVSELKNENKTYKQFECFWLEFLIYKIIPTFSKRYGPITMTWSMKNLINEDHNMVDKFYDDFFIQQFPK